MSSKCLIQFSVDRWGCIPSLLFGLRPNYGGVNGDLLQKALCQHCSIQCPDPIAGHWFQTGTSESWQLKPLIHIISPFGGGVHYLHHSLVSGQTTEGRGHPSTEKWIKDLLSMAPPVRTRPSFPHSQSLTSGSFH